MIITSHAHTSTAGNCHNVGVNTFPCLSKLEDKPHSQYWELGTGYILGNPYRKYIQTAYSGSLSLYLPCSLLTSFSAPLQVLIQDGSSITYCICLWHLLCSAGPQYMQIKQEQQHWESVCVLPHKKQGWNLLFLLPLACWGCWRIPTFLSCSFGTILFSTTLGPASCPTCCYFELYSGCLHQERMWDGTATHWLPSQDVSSKLVLYSPWLWVGKRGLCFNTIWGSYHCMAIQFLCRHSLWIWEMQVCEQGM